MFLSDIAVKKPVFAIVINLLFIAFGLISLERLALREYPDIDPPVVSIETEYSGAAAQTVENRITKVLEGRISGIAGIKMIEAKSVDGLSSITIEFTTKRNIDACANDVRERVSRVLDDLPTGASPPEIFKVDSNNNVILWLNLASSKMNALELTDYAERHIVDELSVVDGVARVRIGGAKRYAIRVWLDRRAMVGKKVGVQDIVDALRENNVELPAGRVESNTREFTLWLKRQFNSPEEFSNLVIRREKNGHLLRLNEVAKVALGAENRRNELRGNGIDMVGLGIVKQSKANTLSVSRGVKAAIAKFKLPQGTEIIDSYDTSLFIDAAIFEVYKTFIIALLLVLLVIYAFLGRMNNVLIPFVTIPISLIATFILLYHFGFSLNLLTLLGLVLAIGLVVDDAIVVLENINRRLKAGEPALLASYNGARQVGFAVIATTMVLLAVFLPIALLEGNIGRLFTEFAITIAAGVVFSSITALTLTPVMCARLLKKPASIGVSDTLMRFSSRYYLKGLRFCLRHGWLMTGLFVLIITMSLLLFRLLPSQLVPVEDRGAFFVTVLGPEGASYDYMQKYMRQIESAMMKPVDQGVATRALSLLPIGFGKSDPVNSGLGIVLMKPWGDREVSTLDVMADLQRELATLPGVMAYPVMRSGIGNRGARTPLQFVIGNTSYDNLVKWRDILLAEAKKNPYLLNVDSDHKPTKLQFEVDINHQRAAELGISTKAIGQTLATYFGSGDVTTFIDKDEEYDVILESDLQQKASIDDLRNIYLRSTLSDKMIPLSNVATIEEKTTPNALYRYNRNKAITITASLASGYSLGEALAYFEKIVQEKLPPSVTTDHKGQSRDYIEAQYGIYFTFALALIIMYLVMAAQFGSFIHPLVLLVTAPLAIAGALFGLYVTGNSLNIYSQIGIIMLTGLAAKNGILMIEFINQLREQGMAFTRAIVQGSIIRLRPVLMTAISTVFGSIPLILATGAGAQSRISIGIVIFFGISLATLLTLFAVPLTYALVARQTKARNYHEKALAKATKSE